MQKTVQEIADLEAAVAAALRDYLASRADWPVVPQLDAPAQALAELSAFLEAGGDLNERLRTMLRCIAPNQLNTASSHYFGVFNPKSDPYALLGALLGTIWNPQLASQTSAPLAIPLEQRTLHAISEKLSYPFGGGQFLGSGSEANFTALALALRAKIPEWASRGIGGYQVRVYASSEAHHSIHRAARLAGLGSDAVVGVAVDSLGRLDTQALRTCVQSDLQQGQTPCLVVGTAGTTAAGVVDPLSEIAECARDFRLWFHVDGAWGLHAAIVPEFKSLFLGLAHADSFSVDAHKGWNAPFCSAVLVTRHAAALQGAFRVHGTTYMPKASTEASEQVQPYAESLAWSREFRGLRVFTLIALRGWEGMISSVRNQAACAQQLRDLLCRSGWRLCNQTTLPVVCFVDPAWGEAARERVAAVAERLASEEGYWVTPAEFLGKPCLRAGIANYETSEQDIENLVAALERVRSV